MHIPSGHAYLAHIFPERMEQARQLSDAASAESIDSSAMPTDKVTISQPAYSDVPDRSNKTSTYDFSYMAPQRLLQVINDEIKNGTLTLDESSSMLLLIPLSFTGGPPPDYDMPTNLFSRMEQWLKFDESIHNDRSVVYDKMALSALRRLQGTLSEEQWLMSAADAKTSIGEEAMR
ncbi:MAG TPA: hypothetical protein DEA71_20540 [Nitrospira sp.]|nr:hypothetical protein [Nitrospira sp.]